MTFSIFGLYRDFMARPRGRSKDIASDKGRSKRTTITTIETHEVWIIRGVADGSGGAADSENQTRALPGAPTPQQEEEKSI